MCIFAHICTQRGWKGCVIIGSILIEYVLKHLEISQGLSLQSLFPQRKFNLKTLQFFVDIHNRYS